MKFVGGSTGLFVAILVVIMTLFIQTEANWYGKRGNKVDDTLFKLLEGNVLRMSERQQMETQITLWAIRDKVDDTLFQLLEGNVPSMSERQQMDAQMTLRAISKLISDYQLRQFEHAEGKPGNKR